MRSVSPALEFIMPPTADARMTPRMAPTADATATAQRVVASALRSVRAENCPPGTSTMPWFVSRSGKTGLRFNFGDELNLDLGAAILSRHVPRTPRSSSRSPEKLVTTTMCNQTGKFLAIGSVIGCAEDGDVVYGAGAKPHGKNASFKWVRPTTARILAVRGPKTCDALAARGMRSCPRQFGDPGLLTGLLVRSWMPLRWQPSSESEPAVLCVAPHFDDTNGLGSSAGRAATSAAERLRACLGWPPVPKAERERFGYVDKFEAEWRAQWASVDASLQRACRAHAQIRVVVMQMRDRIEPTVSVARHFVKCDLVASSALHGLIAADALRVPSVWLGAFPSYATRDAWKAWKLAGNISNHEPDYKFDDYYAGVGRAPVRAPTIAAARQLLAVSDPRDRPQPRFGVAELRDRALEYVRNFPFGLVCTVKRNDAAW